MIKEMADPFAFFKKIFHRIAPAHLAHAIAKHPARKPKQWQERNLQSINRHGLKNKYSEIHPMRDQDSD